MKHQTEITRDFSNNPPDNKPPRTNASHAKMGDFDACVPTHACKTLKRLLQNILSEGLFVGDLLSGGICPRGLLSGGICPRGLLSGGFCPRGFLSGASDRLPVLTSQMTCCMDLNEKIYKI